MPATLDQIRRTREGDWISVPHEIEDDLKRLDAGFRVRFSHSGQFWCVFHQHHEGCPHNGTGGPGSTYMVLTAQAYRNSFGVWEGLDQRVVRELERTNPAKGYDLTAELDRKNREAEKRKVERRHEALAPIGEHAAHAVRKDLGVKQRAFIKSKPEVS